MPLPEKSLTESLLWDRIGIGISGICAIHCLILPVLISLMPLWGFTSFMHGWAHPIFLLLLVPTIFYAARRSYFEDRKSTRLNSSHVAISYAVFCLKKKKKN